jgi:hypothetical protein
VALGSLAQIVENDGVETGEIVGEPYFAARAPLGVAAMTKSMVTRPRAAREQLSVLSQI